jgi:hypothetical protein
MDWINLAQERDQWRALVYKVINVRFEVFTAVTMKNAVFLDVAPCRYCVNRRFGGTSVHTRSTQHHIPEDGILQSNKPSGSIKYR